VARGFESKQVEFQQEEAARGRAPSGPRPSAQERERLDLQRALSLSRSRAVHDLSRATAPAHRVMLEHAIAALDAELARLTDSPTPDPAASATADPRDEK
jgi:hypothetical protein